MGACLGVYVGEKVIKYAKLEQDEKTKKISLNSYGTKYVWGKKEDEVAEIIAQTGSENSRVCLNIPETFRIETEVLKQLKKSDVQSVISLEVADNAIQRGVNEKMVDHRYTLIDSKVSNTNAHAIVEVANKSDISRYVDNPNIKRLAGIYPIEHLLNKLTSNTNNYILLNVDEETTMIFVSNNVPVEFRKIDVNMKSILDTLAIQEGSYAKACELCRTINVLSDDELDYKLESVIEPVIQDLLNRVGGAIEDAKFQCGKIVLNGLMNLFINIEVLFEQFFGIETEKLKPEFLDLDETTANMAEVIETNEALALAYEGLMGFKKELNFHAESDQVATTASSPLKLDVKNLFTKNKSGEKKPLVLPQINIDKAKVEKYLLLSNLTAASVLICYLVFSVIYTKELDNMKSTLNQNISYMQVDISKVKSDISYIEGVKSKYTTYNNYVTSTVAKIKEGKLGKYSTYNVANFMQKLAKYIPTGIELTSLASNDNKTVTIVAKSKSYSELGYFVSQLKLKGILENVKVGNVEHGSYITVTIGGDLP